MCAHRLVDHSERQYRELLTQSIRWEGTGRYRAARAVTNIQSLENSGQRYVAFGICGVFTSEVIKTSVHGIESGKSSLSSPRSGPIASGKTVGLLDTFLIGSLSVYDLLIIIISMIIIMVSTFVFIYI